jgi:dihydroxyacid dehydratase/phosphogluconate dehydratase
LLVAGGVPAFRDGVSQGQGGMNFALGLLAIGGSTNHTIHLQNDSIGKPLNSIRNRFCKLTL